MRTALIYREELLRPSETFIAAQANSLRRYRPVYVGRMPAEFSLPLDHESELLLRKRILPRLMSRMPCWATRIAGGFHRRVSSRGAALLHAHFATDAAGALPLMLDLGIPTVVTLHGYDVMVNDDEMRKTPAGRTYLRHRESLWRRASLFVCVSGAIRNRALKTGFPEHKLFVHYIGIDRRTFTPNDQPREPLVLFVGRFVEKKGCRYLVQAMQKVQQAMPEAQVALIGFGPLQGALEILAGELGVRVTFPGRCSSTEVKKWLERAKVLCVPSVTAQNGDCEGLPTVIMEANAVGIPVVGFEHAGIPEIVKHGETGLLYPEGDVDGLAVGLLRFLREDAFWRAAGRAAARRVGEHFDIDSQGAKLEEIYDEVIAQAGAVHNGLHKLAAHGSASWN